MNKQSSKTCKVCGSLFYNFRINNKGQRIGKYTIIGWEQAKFCSRQCYYKSLVGNIPSHKGSGQKYNKKPCSICGEDFERGKRDANQWDKAKFCTVDCLVKSKIGVSRPDAKLLHLTVKTYSKGDKHWNWKGGITPELHKLRNSPEYISWRNSVYKRDWYTCQECKTKCTSKTIVAHHHKSFSSFPKLRYTISNGITLCRSCHKKVHREIGEDTRFT